MDKILALRCSSRGRDELESQSPATFAPGGARGAAAGEALSSSAAGTNWRTNRRHESVGHRCPRPTSRVACTDRVSLGEVGCILKGLNFRGTMACVTHRGWAACSSGHGFFARALSTSRGGIYGVSGWRAGRFKLQLKRAFCSFGFSAGWRTRGFCLGPPSRNSASFGGQKSLVQGLPILPNQ